MSLLEQEGFVRTVPRRGIFVVRKTKAEIIEMMYIWAVLESTSARLATQRASDEAIASLRPLFTGFDSSRPNKHTRSEERRVGKECVSTCRSSGSMSPQQKHI